MPMAGRKTRLDQLLVERRLAETRSLAQRLIMAGEVRVNGQLELRPGKALASDVTIELISGPAFVSRGGHKLAAALELFQISVAGRTCADVGASTGGFTDCLLQNGAARVYAIDVGHGVLHWKLRQDERVVVMERTNARHLKALPEAVDLVTIDASFISLGLLLAPAAGWMTPEADLIALIKPQFEAGRRQVGHGGVVRDPDVRRQAIAAVAASAAECGLWPHGVMRSPLMGPKGNVEFLLWCRLQPPARAPFMLPPALLAD
jgi:23S rRNA (cytidine1920-2'-O)/16S rRNA (cytidine1409-2'-O)-methyltransferase